MYASVSHFLRTVSHAFTPCMEMKCSGFLSSIRGCLAGSVVDHVTLDLGALSLSLTLGL